MGGHGCAVSGYLQGRTPFCFVMYDYCVIYTCGHWRVSLMFLSIGLFLSLFVPPFHPPGTCHTPPPPPPPNHPLSPITTALHPPSPLPRAARLCPHCWSVACVQPAARTEAVSRGQKAVQEGIIPAPWRDTARFAPLSALLLPLR